VKKLFAIVLLTLSSFCVFAESYTEWYVQTTGNNLNSGSTPDNTATYTAVNGNWDGAGIYTPTDGSTPANTVTNGSWASIYLDAATVAVYVAQVTNVAAGANGAISLSRVATAGSAPTSSGTGRSIKVGGAWAGPNTNQNPSVTFPWAFMVGTLTNSPSLTACYNFKSAIYSWTNTVTMASSTTVPMRVSGYRTTVRDGVLSTNSGNFAGSSFTLLTISAANVEMTDFAFMNNGNSGNSIGVTISGGGSIYRRIYVSGMRGTGLSMNANSLIEESEFFANNANATADLGGLKLNGAGAISRNCIAQGNSGPGFVIQGGGHIINGISFNNIAEGIDVLAPGVAVPILIQNCDTYSNGKSGIDLKSLIATQGNQIDILNCNFFKNGGMGITNTANTTSMGRIANCTFGSGTQANTFGDVASTVTNAITLINPLSYTSGSLPWVDVANGNFSQSTSSLNRSRGTSLFLQTLYSSPTNTVSFPDAGATQASDTNQAAFTFAQ